MNDSQMNSRLQQARISVRIVALSLLLIATSITPTHAQSSGSDEHAVIHRVARPGDCPDITVLGSGVGLLSLSPRGFLGVEASNLTPELRRHFGVDDETGVMLSRVVEGSAAATAGLRVGDIVTRVEEEDIASASRLGRIIRQQEGGATVTIDYWREGSPLQTTAALEERQRCAVDVGDYLQTLDLDKLIGLELDIDLDGLQVSREAIQEAMSTVRDALETQDWTQHLEGLQALDFEKIERRMERVQERLERLEQRLETEHARDYEHSERQRERDERLRERNRERDREDGQGQSDTY